MLRVPALKPGEEDFDPELSPLTHPKTHSAKHTLPLPERREETETPAGTLAPGFEKQFIREEKRKNREAETERMEELKLRATLNHAVVKDAVTQLHCEDDEQMAALERYDGIQICDIRADHDRFLRAQADKYAALCKNEAQTVLFRKMTEGYFRQSRERAKRVQMRKAARFREQVVERQNAEFLERALREEVVFDDAALTGFRDLMLYNLENLLAVLPEGERKTKMDAASLAFYRGVMERRLELGPERVRSMLDAKEVRRVLGETMWKEYEARAESAVRDDVLKAWGREWAQTSCTPREAERLAGETLAHAEEREVALRYYADFRLLENGRECFSRITEIGLAWQAVREGGYRVEGIPERVRRNDPEGYEFLCCCLEKRENRGGLPWPVRWGELCLVLRDFSLRGCLEELRDATVCYGWIDMAGGPESEVWALILRLLAGKLTREDGLFLRDMGLAWGGGRDDGFMERFFRERWAKEHVGELDIMSLIRELEVVDVDAGTGVEMVAETSAGAEGNAI